MQSTEAATLYRKSGEAEGSAVRPSGFPNSRVLTHTLQGRDSVDNLSAFLKTKDLLRPAHFLPAILCIPTIAA